MKIGFNIPASKASLTAALEGLTAVNYLILRNGKVPPLYRSGVRYKREQPGKEQWQTATEVYRARFGDCEDLAAWRAAELRLAGEAARAVVIRTGRRQFHAIVKRANGTYEDPSRKLGMGKNKKT